MRGLMFGVHVTPSPTFTPGTATSASPLYLGSAPAAGGGADVSSGTTVANLPAALAAEQSSSLELRRRLAELV